ncbi:MAG: hypothetical protein WDO19_18145 [Bacteroidota bacterium]
MSKDNKGRFFTAKINLDGLKFPASAKIIIEPNYKGVYQRFYFGTVEHFKHPDDTSLNELPETEIAYFDVSVVDENEKLGLILGKARGIVISSDGMPSDRIPLLYVNPADLNEQLWKLTFDTSDDGRPVLEINKNIPNLYEIARNNIDFISLVYPIAFRAVLQRIVEYGDFDSGEDSWITQWLKFISIGLGIKVLPDTEADGDSLTSEQESWIDDCVNSYCRKFNLFEKFTTQS